MRKVCFMLVWLYLFVIPFDQMIYFGEGIGGISRVITILSIPVVVLTVAASGEYRKLTVVHFLMLGHFVVAAASVFWSLDVLETARSVRTYLQDMVVVWLVWEFAPDTKRLAHLAGAYVLGAWVSFGATLGNFHSDPRQILHGDRRFTATGILGQANGFNENDLALVLVLGIPLACYAALHSSRLMRLVCIAYICAAPVAVALTGSRGGAVACAVAITGTALFGFRGHLSAKTVVAVLLVAVVFCGLSLVPEQTLDRIKTMTSSRDMSQRVPIWHAGLRTFAEYPLMGVGSGAFTLAAGVNYVAHNTFLSVLVEQGLIGCLPFATMLAIMFVSVRGLQAPARNIWTLALLCWCVGVFALTWEQTRWTWALFALAVGAAADPEEQREPAMSYQPAISLG